MQIQVRFFVVVCLFVFLENRYRIDGVDVFVVVVVVVFVQVVERAQQILVQEQEILRRQKELEAKVRRPADAEKFRSVPLERDVVATRIDLSVCGPCVPGWSS